MVGKKKLYIVYFLNGINGLKKTYDRTTQKIRISTKER